MTVPGTNDVSTRIFSLKQDFPRSSIDIDMNCFLILLLLLAPGDSRRIECVKKAPNPLMAVSDVRTESNKESEKTTDGYTGSVAVVDCFDEMVYRYTGGRYVDEPIRFRLRSPRTIEPGRTYPLIVWFHGRGESGNDNVRQLAHMQTAISCLAGPDNKEFFLLAVQCPDDNREWEINVSKEDGKGDATIIILREIMEAVIDEFPVDEDRISVYGLSSGGEAACRFVSESPERFSALAFASAVPPPGSLTAGMNIWGFCCDRDQNVPLDAVRYAVDTVNRENGSAWLTVIESDKHDSWTCSLRDKNVLGWLVAQKRGSLLNAPPGWNPKKRSLPATFGLFGLPILCFVVLSLLVSRSRTCPERNS